MSNRAKVISLYRQLMQEADKFTTSNFRVYAKNRIHHEFELNRNVTDLAKQKALIEKAEKSLSSLKRQVIVSQLFPAEKSVLDARK